MTWPVVSATTTPLSHHHHSVSAQQSPSLEDKCARDHVLPRCCWWTLANFPMKELSGIWILQRKEMLCLPHYPSAKGNDGNPWTYLPCQPSISVSCRLRSTVPHNLMTYNTAILLRACDVASWARLGGEAHLCSMWLQRRAGWHTSIWVLMSAVLVLIV